MGEFDGQVAVVTGGARGIGAEIARRLARGGARVVCADVLDTADIVAEITQAGGAAEGRELNVTDAEGAAASIKAVYDAHGRIDILINNAGITRDKLLVRMKPEDWDLVLDVNLNGVFKVTQPVAKLMMRQKSGRIVNVASVVGLMGNAGQANYAASKAGLIGLTKTTAKELASKSVRCNAVAPGFIQTEMTDVLPQQAKDMALAQIPLKRFGQPVDIAKAVGFLASDDSNYITGQVLSVDGGMHT